jgi:hypothetical protein
VMNRPVSLRFPTKASTCSSLNFSRRSETGPRKQEHPLDPSMQVREIEIGIAHPADPLEQRHWCIATAVGV